MHVPATAAPPSSASSLDPLNVVVLYDDPPAYRRALKLLVRTLANLKPGFDLRVQPWTFEMIGLSTCHRYASEDVHQAHIIVVARTADRPLPTETRSWIQSSLNRARSTPAMVVALLSHPDSDPSSSQALGEFLRTTSQAAGLSYLAPAT